MLKYQGKIKGVKMGTAGDYVFEGGQDFLTGFCNRLYGFDDSFIRSEHQLIFMMTTLYGSLD